MSAGPVKNCFALTLLLTAAAAGGSLDRAALQSDFDGLAAGIDGRVGVCAQDRADAVCVNGDRRFAMQSVMKLLVAMAVMDAVDRQGWSLAGRVNIRKEDLSLYTQPLADLVTASGYQTNIDDLARRAVVDSDSAAVDILVKKLGGPPAVQAFLDRKHLTGVRFDRDEKHLQTEIVGLEWRPEFVTPAVLQRAIDAVPKSRRDESFQRYLTDPRDTATPRGMAQLLQSLAEGKLLSGASTRHLLRDHDQHCYGSGSPQSGPARRMENRPQDRDKQYMERHHRGHER